MSYQLSCGVTQYCSSKMSSPVSNNDTLKFLDSLLKVCTASPFEAGWYRPECDVLHSAYKTVKTLLLKIGDHCLIPKTQVLQTFQTMSLDGVSLLGL